MDTPIGVKEFYTFLLVFARVGGLMVAAPLLGNKAIPGMAKAGFAAVFALAVTPLALPHAGPIPEHLFILAGQVMTDVLFGLAIGYLARVLFAAVEMAGWFVDTQMGFGIINLLDPFSEQQSSVLSMFQYQLAVTLYLRCRRERWRRRARSASPSCQCFRQCSGWASGSRSRQRACCSSWTLPSASSRALCRR
jgi:flagellar biosynthetic protein FliR